MSNKKVGSQTGRVYHFFNVEKHISQATELFVPMFKRRLRFRAPPIKNLDRRLRETLGSAPLETSGLTLTDYLGTTSSILSSSRGDGRRRFASVE